MKSVYECTNATAYLECQSHDQWMICEIFTDHEQRGRGFATRLLEEICRDADHEGVDLILEVCPIDLNRPGLAQSELSDWYRRHGFRRYGHSDCLFYMMRRECQDVHRIAA